MIDRYTKVILTIIAICLLTMLIKPLLNQEVQAKVIRERIGGQSRQVLDINIIAIDDKPFSIVDVNEFHPALPVKIKQ